MAIINSRLLSLNKQLQNQLKIKQEETQKEQKQTADNNSPNSNNGQKTPDEEVKPQTSVCSLNQDLLLTYRGINIDPMETAETKAPVVSGTTGIKQTPKTKEPAQTPNSNPSIADKYIVDSSLAKNVIQKISKTVTGTNMYSGAPNSIISIVSSYAKGNMRQLYSLIKEDLTKQLGDDYDEKTMEKIVNEAIEKTIKIFTDNKTEKQKTCSPAHPSDKGFVISPMAQSGKYSTQRACAYDLQNLCDTFIKAFNESVKNNAKTLETNYRDAHTPSNEPKIFRPADYFTETTDAPDKALGSMYYYAKTNNIKGNDSNLPALLNQSAYNDLQKVGKELIKELKEKLGKNFNPELVESVIRQAINQTIVSFDDKKSITDYADDLDENQKGFSVVKAYNGKITSGSYNTKALVDSFIENFNSQIINASSAEELIKNEPVNKYDGAYLLNRYGLTENILRLYYDKGVDEKGNFYYTIKDDCKIKPANMKNDCYQRVSKSLIIQNFINDKIDYSTPAGAFKTKNGTIINASNFHLFMDEITLYADDKSSFNQREAIQKLQTKFAQGNISFSMSGAIANALGAENIKQSISQDNYSLSFKFLGHEYNLLCSKKAGLNGSDDKTVTLYSKSDLAKFNASQETIGRYFYNAVTIDGEVSSYALCEGMTIEALEHALNNSPAVNEAKEIIIKQKTNYYQNCSENMTSTMLDSLFEKSFESALKAINYQNVNNNTSKKIFEEALSANMYKIDMSSADKMTSSTMEKISSAENLYYERFKDNYPNKIEFEQIFANASKKALEALKNAEDYNTEDISYLLETEIFEEVNSSLWEKYENSQNVSAPAQRSFALMSNTIPETSNVQAIKGTTTQTKCQDGTTVEINYDVVNQNGTAVTNPSNHLVIGTVTITNPDGTQKSYPIKLAPDVLDKNNPNESLKNYLNDLQTAISGLNTQALEDLQKEVSGFFIDKSASRFVSDGVTGGFVQAAGKYNPRDNFIQYCAGTDFDASDLTHEIGHAVDSRNNISQTKGYSSDKYDSQADAGTYGVKNNNISSLFSQFKSLMWKDPHMYSEFFDNNGHSTTRGYPLKNAKEFFADYYSYKNGIKGASHQTFWDIVTKEAAAYPNSDLAKTYNKLTAEVDNTIAYNQANRLELTTSLNNNSNYADDFKKLYDSDQLQTLKAGGVTDSFGKIYFDETIKGVDALFNDVKDTLAKYYEHTKLNKPNDVFKKLDSLKTTDALYNDWQKVKNYLEKNVQQYENLKMNSTEKETPAIPENNNNNINYDKDTNKKPNLNVTGSINVKNVTGFVRTGDGLFLKADGKGSYSSEFYENAVRAAIEKYGEGLSISFTAQSDGTINYTITNNDSNKVTNYIVVDSKSGYILNGHIDNSNSSNLSASDRLKFKEYAQNHSLEEMMAKDLNSTFNFKSDFPAKLEPIFIEDEYINPKTGKLDTERMLKDLFLKDSNIIYTGNESYSGKGKTAGNMYLALMASIAQTGSIDSAINVFNQMTRDQRFQGSWTGSVTENMYDNMGAGTSHDRIGQTFIGFAIMSDAFASFNKIMLTKHGMSISEINEQAIEFGNYVKRLTDCLTGGGAGGTISGGNSVDPQILKKVNDIFQKYNDPTERMIAIINETDFGLSRDTRMTEFAKMLKEEMDKDRNLSHGAFNGQGTGNSVIDNDFGGMKPPPIIIDEEKPKNPFTGGNSKEEETDPFKKPERPPINKF